MEALGGGGGVGGGGGGRGGEREGGGGEGKGGVSKGFQPSLVKHGSLMEGMPPPYCTNVSVSKCFTC